MKNPGHLNARRALLAAGAILLGSAGAASAASVSYTLDQTNADPTVPDGVGYLSVTISDAVFEADLNAIRFDVSILDPLVDLGDTGFGIRSFAFNTTGDPATVAGSIDGQPTYWYASYDRNMGGFGDFDVRVAGGPWQNPTLTFYITGIDGDTLADYAGASANSTEGITFFAAHVDGLIDQDPGDAILKAVQFGGSLTGGGGNAEVPAPAAVWLFGSAIGIVGLFVRSRKVA